MENKKQIAWKDMIFATVYEIQWGNGLPMTYKRYFDDVDAVEAFRKETGYRVEIE